MKLRRDIIFVGLAIFCLTATLFMVKPTRSQSANEYSPWTDLNDDGKINIIDLVKIALAFGAEGDPIDKTALLIKVNATFANLQSRMDELNASLLELQSKMDSMNATRLDDLENRVNTLESSKMVWNSTYLYATDTTETSLPWKDVENATHKLSVTISVNKPSYLLVMFSTMAYNQPIDPPLIESFQIYVQAVIDTQVLDPTWLRINPIVEQTGFELLMPHHHMLTYGTYSYNFQPQLVSAGNHSVKMQWLVSDGRGYLAGSTLTVIALPIQ